MPKFGLTRPLGYGPFKLPYRPTFGPVKRDLSKLSFGYLKSKQRKYGIYKLHNAARKIQKIYRGSSIRRKFPVKLFAKMRATGRYKHFSQRLSSLYK